MTDGSETLMDGRLLLLNRDDNCVVARVAIPAGTEVAIEGTLVILRETIPVGHKLARRALASGEEVRKCGAVIGRTSTDVRIGESLHIHNLESCYLPAHLIGGASDNKALVDPRPATISEHRARSAVAVVEKSRIGDFGLAQPSPGVAGRALGGTLDLPTISGFPRSDGRKGIRNVLAVVYTVECAHHVASRIADYVEPVYGNAVQVIGFPGCYPNDYAQRVLGSLCTHPNVGGALIISLGCESFDAETLLMTVRESGRWAERLTIQEDGGTTATIEKGRALVASGLAQLSGVTRVPMALDELVVGTICGGSDATSVLTANPAVGKVFDYLVGVGGICIFEETGELIGCEESLRRRGFDPAVGEEIAARVRKAAEYYHQLGHASIAPGNVTGGLTTIEEKSVGAYAKSGSMPIAGVIEPGEVPKVGGLYLLDVVPAGPVRFGYPNINDTTEVVDLMSCGCQVVLFTTGRGSVVGSAIAPILKICANPETYKKLADDMDVNAGRVLLGATTIDEVGREIVDAVVRTVNGVPTRSEALGHQEFQLGYKVFRWLEPSCLA